MLAEMGFDPKKLDRTKFAAAIGFENPSHLEYYQGPPTQESLQELEERVDPSFWRTASPKDTNNQKND
jgi:hypothetical protein